MLGLHFSGVLEESEDTYLPIIGSGPASDGGVLSSPEHTR